ncbi:MAG: RagB/SusD family nutrient uptake outer membrane protein [Bacteroidetes bacterium]|nr:RagB/SusD family nutrient uptake outer membrane protein [Bacteroidota bacterium]
MKNLISKIKIRYAGLLIVWLLTAVGCERPFLEPWPPDGARLPKDIWEFYNFARGMLFRVMGDHMPTYSMLGVTGPAHLASACDEAEHSLSQSLVQSFNDGAWGPSRTIEFRYGGTMTNNVRTTWYNSYTGIRRVNNFLDNLDNSAIINNPAIPSRNNEREVFRGSAYFLRAWLNFDLFRTYGQFVIVDEVLTLEGNLELPRNTLQECYDFIIADLDDAIELLPYVHDDLNWYMPTKTMAQTVKAVTQLYWASPLFQGEDRELYPYGLPANTVGDTDRWLDVVESVRAAIQENPVHNLMTITKWNRPHSDANTYTARLVFTNYPTQTEVVWGTSWYSQSNNSYYNEVNSLPDGEDGCNGLTNPTQEMVDAYEVVPLQTGGTSAGRPVVGAPSAAFDWNNPAHVADPYNNRDPRFYASIMYNGYLWGTQTAFRYTIDTYDAVSPYPGGKHRDYARPNHTKTGYYYRKFIPESYHRNLAGGHFVDFQRIRPYFRFAELLLIYAEAMNEAYGGPDVVDPNGALRAINTVGTAQVTPATAREAVNAVRARVGMPLLPTGLTQNEMREKIKHERRIELAFEERRFWDLRRWKMGDVLGAPIHGVKITPTAWDTSTPPRPTAFTYEKVQVEERYWEDKMYWHPIPYDELIKYNGVIKQNPGW